MVAQVIRVSDFEWASVSRYIVEVSVIMGLSNFNWDLVHSFPYERLGPDKLKARKIRLLCALMDDLDVIDGYVKENEKTLGKEEFAVLRGMYKQYDSCRVMLEEHLARIETFRAIFNAELLYVDIDEGVYENEPPF